MFKKIDPKFYVEEGLQTGNLKGGFYAKFARVRARQGVEGEEIVTIMQNGLVETKNVVTIDETGKPGWVVTNPSGEQYIIPNKTFLKKYEIDEKNPEVYKPKGGVIIAVQINEDVSFTAPWGEEMNIKNGGYLVCSNLNDIYGIQEKEFNETYKECTRKGVFLDERKQQRKERDSELTM